jgi:hypothetical protein
VRVSVTGSLALTFLLLAVASGHAQVAPLAPPPSPGFVSSYEIMHTLRSAGFDPLAPPLREGTIYVARATDYRGILMRVVLDARTGAIRDANRIVPGPGAYGQIGMLPPDDMPPYAEAPGFDPAGSPLDGDGPLPPSGLRPVTRSTVTVFPPLPRPRPAELARADVKPAVAIDPKPESKTGDTNAALPTPPGPAPAKPSKSPGAPSIND